MCNAWNHSYSCPCAFRGGHGGGGWRAHAVTRTAEYVPPGFEKANKGTVASYINPNATCPKCGASVWFYRSPYDGRVFFDDIGWPWPKHGCTDNPRPRAAPRWRAEGWDALLSPKVYSDGDRLLVTGDAESAFLELHLPRAERLDKESPVFVRALPMRSDLFEATFLRSDCFKTHERKAVAFHIRLAAVGEDTILKAAADDPDANYVIGLFFLTHFANPDVASARPYLEAAASRGHVEALIELAVIALLVSPKR